MSVRGCRSTSTLGTCTLLSRSTGKSHLLASRAPPSAHTHTRVPTCRYLAVSLLWQLDDSKAAACAAAALVAVID